MASLAFVSRRASRFASSSLSYHSAAVSILAQRGFSNGKINGLHPRAASARNKSSTKEKTDTTAETSKAEIIKDTSASDGGKFLKGSTIDHAVDLNSLRPGDRLDIPYEMTVTDALVEFWHGAFYSQDRIHTSRPFCRNMGLQDRVIPFSLLLFLTSSMSHEDAARVQVGFKHVWYEENCGDSLEQSSLCIHVCDCPKILFPDHFVTSPY